MDMEVDTKVLDAIRNALGSCRSSLNGASNDLKTAVTNAGLSLEGRQYSLSVQETEASCGIVDASAKNLASLDDYVGRLKEDVECYLKCKYRG